MYTRTIHSKKFTNTIFLSKYLFFDLIKNLKLLFCKRFYTDSETFYVQRIITSPLKMQLLHLTESIGQLPFTWRSSFVLSFMQLEFRIRRLLGIQFTCLVGSEVNL